jgi:serine/threonine protein kinase
VSFSRFARWLHILLLPLLLAAGKGFASANFSAIVQNEQETIVEWTEVLGVGDAGVVFAATTSRGRSVAVKVFLPPTGDGERDEAEHERAIATELLQKNLSFPASRLVLPLLDIRISPSVLSFSAPPSLRRQSIQANSKNSIVYPRCTKDLHTYYNEIVLPETIAFDFTRRIVADVAFALHMLHSRGKVHADLKFENILLAESPLRAYVGDFNLLLNIGYVGQFGGVFDYLAPEYFPISRGITRAQHPARDIWALGVILFELLAKRDFIDTANLYVRLYAGAPTLKKVREPENEGEASQLIVAATLQYLISGHLDAFLERYLSALTPRDLRNLLRAMLDPVPERRPSAEEIVRILEVYSRQEN